MVDYTDFEEERLREKRKMFQINITSPTGPTQREELLRERKILGGLLNFIKVCHNEFFERTT